MAETVEFEVHGAQLAGDALATASYWSFSMPVLPTDGCGVLNSLG